MLVLSGGQGEDEPVSEAAAMRDYLLFNGVNERQLILETRSFSTVENIAYSRVAIEGTRQGERHTMPGQTSRWIRESMR